VENEVGFSLRDLVERRDKVDLDRGFRGSGGWNFREVIRRIREVRGLFMAWCGERGWFLPQDIL
jgi:hypothetical protein